MGRSAGFSAWSLSSFRHWLNCSSCTSWGDMYYHPTKREIEIGWAVLLGGAVARPGQPRVTSRRREAVGQRTSEVNYYISVSGAFK